LLPAALARLILLQDLYYCKTIIERKNSLLITHAHTHYDTMILLYNDALYSTLFNTALEFRGQPITELDPPCSALNSF